MVTEANTQTDYRYPGIRPFYDNDIDRRLFFGRDTEKETLLHKVLAENLVVLYARSGLGKTSLLNAGLSQALRDRGFIPLMVRFNDPELDPVQWIYGGIKEIAKQKSIEVEAGEDATLWQYFKTTYFWSGSNKMLTPVLILDQFEEFFTLYSPEDRKGFIRQLADVVNNKIPASLLESAEPGKPFPYDDNPSNVKIIISIREDYVGQLDEMSREIPDILHHRFRLLPLSREQARQAIIKPSQVRDDVIGAASFTFASEAVDTMLDFLCQRMERGSIKMTDEVESFQLQLLCRHIENMVREKTKKEPADIIVKAEDLGGESGMQRVLQRFYDDQVEQLRPGAEKEKVRKLCEEGLISITDRRLSLEEEEITRRFKVSKVLLQELVNRRLLRAEPRVGSVYYELSHDTLVVPIRESQKKRIPKKNSINKLYEEANELKTSLDYSGAAQKYKDILYIDNTYVKAYLELGLIYYDRRNYNEAIEIYNEAIKNGIKNALIYHQLGHALFSAGKTDEAIQSFEEAIKIEPNQFMPYEGLGEVYSSKKEFNKAIKYYSEALNIDENKPGIYRDLAVSYIKAGEPDKAIEIFQKAIKVNPGYADIYEETAKALKEKGKQKHIEIIYELAYQSGSKKASYYLNLGYNYDDLKKYDLAIRSYQKAIDIDPGYFLAKINLAEAYLIVGHFDDAYSMVNDLLKEKDISTRHILILRLVSICLMILQGKQPKTSDQLKDFINYYKSIHGEYERGWEYDAIKTFITQYKKLPPMQTKLLLQLVDLLESPKEQGDKKLKELEIAINKTFK
jgi:tetratricopeptide (TPR) repeat protein